MRFYPKAISVVIKGTGPGGGLRTIRSAEAEAAVPERAAWMRPSDLARAGRLLRVGPKDRCCSRRHRAWRDARTGRKPPPGPGPEAQT